MRGQSESYLANAECASICTALKFFWRNNKGGGFPVSCPLNGITTPLLQANLNRLKITIKNVLNLHRLYFMELDITGGDQIVMWDLVVTPTPLKEDACGLLEYVHVL